MVRGCVNLLTAVFFLSESLSLDVLSLSLKFRRSKILKMHLECMHLSLVLSLSLSLSLRTRNVLPFGFFPFGRD